MKHLRESHIVLNSLKPLLVNDVLNANLVNDVLNVVSYSLHKPLRKVINPTQVTY